MDSELFKIRIAEIKNSASAEEQRRLIRSLYREVTGCEPDDEDTDNFIAEFVSKPRKSKKTK